MPSGKWRRDRTYKNAFAKYVLPPQAAKAWVLWTGFWMTMALSAGISVGVLADEPRHGISIGIFLSGLILIFSIDRMQTESDSERSE